MSHEAATDASPTGRLRIALYAATIFLSAFLLFQIQPLVGRIVLPRFGGVASVWTTCMLFFQGLLLLGYLYAHWLSQKLRPAMQRILHAGLLTIGIVAMLRGLSTSPSVLPAVDPTLAVLHTLFGLVGLPYLILSATGPLLQAWFAAEVGGIPYRLFSLSNLGSMLALLSYPLLIEPALVLGNQIVIWSGAFVVFCGLMIAVAWGAPRKAVRPTAAVMHMEAATEGSPAVWTLLAFCPSVLLLAITHHVSDAIAPIPMLWIVFLCVYLLSFILCFESGRWYRRDVFVPASFVLLILVTYIVVKGKEVFGVRGGIVLFTLALFAASMTCHGELARRKPPPAQLTRFYLWVSVGGVLGGIFVGLIAPHLFDDYHELPIAIVLTLLVTAWLVPRGSLSIAGFLRGTRVTGLMLVLTLAVALALGHQAIRTHKRFALLARNFYGKLALLDEHVGASHFRTLYHGGIIHGFQVFDRRRILPTTYYTPESGVGKAILAGAARGAQDVAVIGLGTGTLAAYGRPGDRYRFYDINPLVVRIAQRSFAFLAESKAAVDIVLGDGRLSLQHEADQRFDLLAVDAFSGDSIPVHLLTREALELYFSRLKPDGILAIHVSNRYLDLVPVVAEHARRMSKAALMFDTDDDNARLQYGTTWVLLAQAPDVFTRLKIAGGEAPETRKHMREWTDDYSSIFDVLN